MDEHRKNCNIKGCGRCDKIASDLLTRQNNTLAEIKDGIMKELMILIREGHEAVINHEEVAEYKAKVDAFLSSAVDQAYEKGRSVGRAETLSEIKGITAKSGGDAMVVLADLLNKLNG